MKARMRPTPTKGTQPKAASGGGPDQHDGRKTVRGTLPEHTPYWETKGTVLKTEQD